MINNEQATIYTKYAGIVTLIIASCAMFIYSAIEIARYTFDTERAERVTMQFTGVGEVFVENNVAEINFTYSELNNDVASLQEAINSKTADVYDQLKNLGIEDKDIQTVGYTVTPEYNYTKERGQELRGYRLSHSTRLRVRDVENVSEALRIITSSNPQNISGPAFTLLDADRRAYEQEALALAIQEAKRNARTTAKGANLKLERLVRINRQGVYTPQPRSYAYAESADIVSAKSSFAPPISQGENVIQVTVNLEYEVEE